MSSVGFIGFQYLSHPLQLRPPQERAARVGILLLMVIFLNAVDLAYTLFAYQHGMLTEVNPLAENFLRLHFTQGLVCYKLVMVLGGCVMLWKLRASRWTSVGCWILVLVYTGLAIVWYMWVKDVNTAYEMGEVVATPFHNMIQP